MFVTPTAIAAGVFIGGVTHTAVSMSAPVIPSIISGVLGIFLSSLI